MVIALLRFLASACDGAVVVTCIDLRMSGNGRGVLVPLTLGVCRVLDEICLPGTIYDSSFDPVASLIAYSWSSEVEWACGLRGICDFGEDVCSADCYQLSVVEIVRRAV